MTPGQARQNLRRVTAAADLRMETGLRRNVLWGIPAAFAAGLILSRFPRVSQPAMKLGRKLVHQKFGI